MAHDSHTPVRPPEAPYSYSQLDLYEKCPRSYWLRYVARLASPETAALRLGSFVHNVLDRAIKAGIAANADARARGGAGGEATFDPLHVSRALDAMPAAQRAESEAMARPQLLTAQAWLMRAWATLAAGGVESEAAFACDAHAIPVAWSGDRRSPAPGAIIRGFIDLRWCAPAGGRAILDWKTGKNAYEVGDDDEHHRQLGTYAWAEFGRADARGEPCDVVAASFFNLRAGDGRPEPAVIITREAAAVSGLWVRALAAEIEARDWHDVHAWEPRKNKLCWFCEHKGDCPVTKMAMAARPAAADGKGVKAAAAGAGADEQATIRGLLRSIAYSKPGSDWKILTFDLAATDRETSETITVKGELAAPLIGAMYELTGKHGSYRGKPEFAAKILRLIAEREAAAIQRVLDRQKWFGPIRSAKAVATFGAGALDAICDTPEAVATACNMPVHQVEEAAEGIRAARDELDGKAELLTLLPNVHLRVANAIWRAWGRDSVARVKADPYALTAFEGIAWQTADWIGAELGIRGVDARRVRAGAVEALRLAEGEGHSCLPRDEFYHRAAQLLCCEIGELGPAVTGLVTAGDIVVYRDREGAEGAEGAERLWVYRAARAAEEQAIADELWRVSRRAGFDRWYRNSEAALAALAPLDETQRAAVVGVHERGCAVITGGPGTGKTFTLRALIASLPPNRRLLVDVCAPTGKAARVLEAATGHRARTAHGLLEPGPGTDATKSRWVFRRNEHNRLECRVYVGDEQSMTDHAMALSMLQAIPDGCWYVLIGDADQLPAVGVGDFFRSVIASGAIPVHRLTLNHRNAGVGAKVCAAINRGEAPLWGDPAVPSDARGNNTFLTPMPAAQQAAFVERLLRDFAPRKGLDPARDVQIITANSALRGEVCAPRMNGLLQDVLNPGGADTGIEDPLAVRARRGDDGAVVEGEVTKVTWRVGDKLVQVKNNWSLGLANGDIVWLRGVKVGTDGKERGRALELTVEDEAGKAYVIPAGDADLQLAYALTVHKFQGSQAPLVIVTLDWRSQSAVVNRQWLYTACSRFQQFCFVLAADGARDVAKAVAKPGDRRWTRLASRLRRGATVPAGEGAGVASGEPAEPADAVVVEVEAEPDVVAVVDTGALASAESEAS